MMVNRHWMMGLNDALAAGRRPRTAAWALSLAWVLGLLLLGVFLAGCDSEKPSSADGMVDPGATDTSRVIRVMLIPADTGADTTLDDFLPLFNAIGRQHGLRFDLKVGTSYAAVVTGMANRQIDIAFLGPFTLYQAQQNDSAELLAVAVKDGSSSYHSVILSRSGSGIEHMEDLVGRSIALGDVNSASSFRYPVAMLLNGGVDPVKDLGRIVITGSHSNAIAALKEGHVDAAGCSLNAYEKAVASGVIDKDAFTIVAVSPQIPNPPLAMHPSLDENLKRTLRQAFANIHEAEGVTPEMVRGYGGGQYDRYDVEFPQARFDEAMVYLTPVTQALINEIIESVSDQSNSSR